MRRIPIQPAMIDPVTDPATDPLAARLRAAGCVYAEEESALLRDAVEACCEDDDLAREQRAEVPAGAPR